MDPHRQQPLRIESRGGRIRVAQQRQVGPALHIAEFPAVAPRRLMPRSHAAIELPRPQHPDVVTELRLLLVELPSKHYDPGHQYLPSDGREGLRIPWAADPRSRLLLPAE